MNTVQVAEFLIRGGYLRGDQAHSLLILASATHTTDVEAS
jgi:hypothetical protein